MTDNGSPNHLSDTLGVTVTVEDVNEPPVISSTMATHTAPSVMEIEFDIADADLSATAKDVVAYTALDPDAGAALTWTVSGTDAAHFSIDSTGKLSFDIRPNFEMPDDTFTSPDTEGDNAYEIAVGVSDGLDDSGMTENPAVVDASLPVIVTVTHVNERPDIDENFDPLQANLEIEYDFEETPPNVHTFNAEDYDDGNTFTWSLSGEDADHLDIGATSGVLTFSPPSAICLNDGPLPDYEEPCDGATGGTNTYNVTVRATDDDTSNQKYSDYAVTITVTDVNERPDIREDSVPDYVEVDFYFTGTPADVHTFTATDYDDGDTFEWSLLGDDAGDLEIDPSTGVLTFTRDSSLNVGPLPSFEDPQDQD